MIQTVYLLMLVTAICGYNLLGPPQPTGDPSRYGGCNEDKRPNIPGCPCDNKVGRWNDWGAWSTCSRTCGGGTKTRCRRERCGVSYRCCDDYCYQNGVCNDKCYNEGDYVSGECICPGGTKGFCCECASPQYCKTPDQWYYCDASYNSFCYECQNDAYYLIHSTEQCGVCSIPRYCKISGGDDVGRGDYWCHEYDPNSHCVPSGACCRTCQNTTASDQAYYLDVDITNQCTPKCNWLGHWCWPGVCDKDNHYLATTCSCSAGFVPYVPHDEITKCHLVHPPDILTCRLGAESPLGEVANSTFKDNSTSCGSTEDVHINFKADHMFFEYSFTFNLPVDPPSGDDRHSYVESFAFGVVHASATISHYDKYGMNVVLGRHDPSAYPVPGMCSVGDFTIDNPLSGLLITCRLNHHYGDLAFVADGEKLCHLFDVTSSGYVDIQDMMFLEKSGVRHYYDQIDRLREVCFMTDFTAPDHCVNVNSSCQKDVLNFGRRIRRDRELNVSFDGWFDPDPGSVVANASGIKLYEIEVRNVIYTPTKLYADFTSIQTYESNGEIVNVTLPDREEPSMYGIYLWALDSTQEGPNFQISRRFVLSDNTSYVERNEAHPLFVSTGSTESNLEWQVHLDYVKLYWAKHFFNTWHVHTNMLLPIRAEGNMSISGPFEQETGELPVSGTPNVDGIVNFQYSYQRISVIGIENEPLKNVPDALTERYIVIDFNPLDGDTVEFRVKAIDIMNNTLEDNVTVQIDSSAALIKDMYLVKDGYTQIFVHNTTDLSEMDMIFKAYDPHSGLQSVAWALGTEDGINDVGTGHLPVLKLQNESCSGECYCPIIGYCEELNYTVPLAGLTANDTHMGDHNREYHFTFTVMNEAHLLTVEKVMILVDTTPPETGHVFDGPPGNKDRDYQSDPLLHFHWEGFLDHESDISKYHIVISARCFSKDEMQFLHNGLANVSDVTLFSEHVDTYITLEAEVTGFYRASVIAFNGAMEPSEAVCSSGVVYDDTPPRLTSVRLIGSVHQQSLLCANDSVYFISHDGIAQKLSEIVECFTRCAENNTFESYRFPLSYLKNGTENPALSIHDSKHICNSVMLYVPYMAIFLKTDTFHLTWDVREPDSQMHDYYVGFGSSINSIDPPDIKSYTATHNKTNYKCIACGIGQGEEIFLALKGVSKAVLTEILPVGPIIIDSTPPMYTSGMEVILDVNNVILKWQFDSFIDEDYEDVFTEYEWALGLTDSPEGIQTWTSLLFPFNTIDIQNFFYISLLRYQIEIFDQGKGLFYVFSLKCFNRARLYTHATSEQFQVYKRITPSEGIVLHTLCSKPYGDEIGFQEDTSVLSVKWFGFTHPSNNVTYAISLGSLPFADDILEFVDVSNTEYYCIRNLSLHPNTMYYATVKAVAGEDSKLVSSKGIYIAQEYEVIENGILNTCSSCPEVFQHVIYSNTSMKETEIQLDNEIHTNVNLSKESVSFVTLRLKFNSFEIQIKENVKVFDGEQELEQSSWTIAEDYVFIYYTFTQMNDFFYLSVFYNGSDLLEAALHHCNIKSNIQVRGNSLTLQWSFSFPHAKWITYSNVFIYNYDRYHQFDNSSYEMWNVGKHNDITLPIELTPAMSYTVCVNPCFQTTCIKASICQHITMDSTPPSTGIIEASMDTTGTGIMDSQLNHISASWEPFVNYGTEMLQKITVYDWTISLDEHGTSPIVEWIRLQFNDTEDILNLHKDVYLHVYTYRTLFFTLRAVNSAGVIRLASVPIKLNDITPASGVQVFDLEADYNLDSLKDFLHSSNLGNMTKLLHDDDIDFTAHTEGISGAILGASCGEYSWAIQTNTDITCTQTGELNCISVKSTSENVVRFTLQSFTKGVNYTLCVSGLGKCSTFKSCSNGFLIDQHPPIAGYVQMGVDGSTVSSDASSLFISWSGFSDIEEEIEIPYGHGIKHYKVTLGSAPMGNDIMPSMLVGLSTHVYLTDLKLPPGRHVYGAVEACDHVDLCTVQASNPVLVDITPPTVDLVHLVCLGGRHNLYGRVLVRWSAVSDTESGIAGVEVAVGQTTHDQDIVQYTIVNGTQIIFTSPSLKDGMLYYSHIKVTNRVGLWTIRSSKAVLYDSTPPESGFVKHGQSNQNDFGWSQNDTWISFHWDGFVDPHSGIFYYRAALGTQPYADDVFHWTDMGKQLSLETELRLEHGVAYYLAVECCNTLLLCSQATSSPLVVDTSPPVPGLVFIGMSEEHQTYQYNRDTLTIRWIGFLDLQSEISHFEWCIETMSDTCDIHPLSKAHGINHVTPHNLNLPEMTPLFVKLIAYNNVGLNVTSWSKEFIIDTTGPIIKKKTQVTTPSSIKQYTQFDRSYISMKWSMNDDGSPMMGYYISIQSHHDGLAPLSDYPVGNINEVTIPLSLEQQFQDGSVYTVKVTGCNAATLCSTSAADNLLVDSSPPVLGGFVEPMSWKKQSQDTTLRLLWTGFSDPHSEIANYYLMVSSNYNGYDLSGEILRIHHDNNNNIQSNDITLNGVELPVDEMIYLTIWAENAVGLFTDAAKISVFVLPDSKSTNKKQGILDIQKHSCDIMYCNNDCTCASVNGYCTPEGQKHKCHQKNATDFVEVFDGINNKLSIYTPSTVCLPGYWENKNFSFEITRYEWSVSMNGHQPGFGVFDPLNEKYLFDVETYDRAVYCTSDNDTFLKGQSYIYHINAWHDFDEYSYFVSTGVTVDSSPPYVGLGRHVLDKNEDFTDRGPFTSVLQGIYSSWDNVFRDEESGIKNYNVSIGTSQGGKELYGPVDVGLATYISLPDILLLPGFHYYTTVSAFNILGMTEFSFSAGFVVDVEPPYSGNVFVGETFHDRRFQSGNTVDVSWHGFGDKHSYIMEYHYCFTEVSKECNEADYISVNLANQRRVDGDFKHGQSYQLHVKAVDAARLESEVVTSHPVLIDNTPPVSKMCVNPVKVANDLPLCQCEPIIAGHSQKSCDCKVQFNSTFVTNEIFQVTVFLDVDPSGVHAKMEVNGMVGWMAFTRINGTFFTHSTTFVSNGLQSTTAALYFDREFYGTPVIYLAKCSSTSSLQDHNLRLIKQVSQLQLHIDMPIYDFESELNFLQVGIGTNQDGLQLLPYMDVGHEKSVLVGLGLQHGMKVHATIIAKNRANLKTIIKSEHYIIDWTPPQIMDIDVQTSVKYSKLSISVFWLTHDEESVVSDCSWAIGYLPITDDILPWESTKNFVNATTDGLILFQGDIIYVTIECCNTLSLCNKVASLPTTVVLEPPNTPDAFVDIQPKKVNVYEPKHDSQASLSGLEYEYHGFQDNAGISYFEYQIHGPGITQEWMNASLQDHIVLPWVQFENGKTYTVNIHAVNIKGFQSANVEDSVLVIVEKPYLTGGEIQWSHVASTLTLDWEKVFFWRGHGGPLVYEVYVGSEAGATDLLMAVETMETSTFLTSERLQPPATCFCFITAVAPSGMYQTYSQMIYL